jgi:hypothetical protein
MNRYRTVRRLSATSAAYIAGIVDGEGTVTLTRHHAGENRRLAVSVANTELPLLQYLVDEVGAGRITRKRTTCPRHTPSFCYAIWSRQALDLLQQLLPHLRSYKRRRAELAVARYRELTPRNGRYAPGQLRRRAAFERALLRLSPKHSRRLATRSPVRTRG